MEGFGIPPLEAASYGANLYLSDIEATKEIFGEKFVYFNPLKVDEFSFEKHLNHGPYNCLENFNWNRSAIKLNKLLKRWCNKK